MIDPTTTWQQVCATLIGPDQSEEDFEAAFAVLDAALGEAGRGKADRPARAQLELYAASLTSLYGDSASDEFAGAVGRARADDSGVLQDPLFLALSAELEARRRGPQAPPPAEAARRGEPLARFHSLAALALGERAEEALALELPVSDLPPHLRWRLRSWQADCEEELGHSEPALLLYAEAAHLARGSYRASMLQEQAALHLQLGQAAEAETALKRARAEMVALGVSGSSAARAAVPPGEAAPQRELSDEPPSRKRVADEQLSDEQLGEASWHYLMAQAELGQDRHDEALLSIQHADRLEREANDPSYGVALVWGQVLAAQGQQAEALPHFEAALELAQPDDRPYALHELGVALLDLDQPLEAREQLEGAAGTPDYPFVPEVLADIAEAEYRLGRLPEAQASAESALAQGAVVPASLVLGGLEMDYYHLDEALEHYLRVTREAAPATRDWVTAQQMVADILAQQGFPDPAAAYSHAQQALEHTDPSDDWYGTLQDHLARAGTMIGEGRGRTLN